MFGSRGCFPELGTPTKYTFISDEPRDEDEGGGLIPARQGQGVKFTKLHFLSNL
jgi:hypothetical protein